MAEPREPSLVVVAVSGLAVLVVVAFVTAVIFGSRPERSPGDRVAVARSGGPAGITVLAGRCTEQRVVDVRLSVPGGRTLWEIRSEHGSIDRRYLVGAEPPPLDFAEVTPLRGVPAGRALVEVTFARGGRADETDEVVVDPGDIGEEPPDLGDAAPPCASDAGPGVVTSVLFALGALVVVAGYATMVVRRWGRR